MLARKALAGTAGAPKVYVEDVFSTYLYAGNDTARTITNGVNLSNGGLVWFKGRNTGIDNYLVDSVRGGDKYLVSNSTAAQTTTSVITSFNNNGFGLSDVYGANGGGLNLASWAFAEKDKFFDVVTYTGNGSNRTISHSLGSTPGCIIVKRTDTTGDWYVYHRSNTANPETDYLLLNSTAATADLDTVWNDTAPTSTVFSVGTNSGVNANTGTYVAYLFAHDAGGFGDAGSDSIIKCGSYSGTGTTNFISLGWEPQWVLVKRSDSTGDWHLLDNMRGWVTDSSVNAVLFANTSGDEGQSASGGWPAATGFYAGSGAYTSSTNTNGGTYIYIAIRRGPMKTPTTGTSVFSPVAYTGNSTTNTTVQNLTTNFAGDATIIFQRIFSGQSHLAFDKLRGSQLGLYTNLTDAEENINTYKAGQSVSFNNTQTVLTGQYTNLGNYNYSGDTFVSYNFKRAPGFFDVVCYTGTGSNTTISHNLGVVPELMIVKRRGTTNAWAVYANNDNTDYLVLNTNAATVDDNTYWNDTSPTSSVFSIGTNNATNASGSTYVAYLFASLSGVSKIGTYTGNGSSVTVTTNFQPRFILVKRTDSTGDWIVSDSARGLVAGNDPYLEFNTSDEEVTNEDWVDISSTSFTVNQTTNNANVNTGTYIYLAIA